MSEYSLSSMAERDLIVIAEYTTDMWGSIRPGLRRMEEASRVFYKAAKRGVFISKILRQSMMPKRHEIEGDRS